MTYYLGKLSTNEYLLLKDKNTIKFSLKTKCFQGIKQFFNSRYLNVLNPDNFIYNLETEIHEFVKDTLLGLELKSNIIFDQKQFLQFLLSNKFKDSIIEPETDLNLDIEVDKIKINQKTKSYQIVLKLLKYKII
jgi:hypothetical protein